jgi:hypothetical protein
MKSLKILTLLPLLSLVPVSYASPDSTPTARPSEKKKVRLLKEIPKAELKETPQKPEGEAPLSPTLQQGALPFEGQLFQHGWSAEAGGSKMREYYLPGEGPQNWTKMLTLQLHPSTTRLSDVTQPYLIARSTFITLNPKAFHNPKTIQTTTPSDTVLQLGLGKPGLTPHFEFVTGRFVACPKGVLGLVFSYKIPFAGDDPNQKINLLEPRKKNSLWREELFKIPTETLLEEFLSKTH